MLDDFITANRDAIIENARPRVTHCDGPAPTADELENGIPAFLRQLTDALRRARSSDVGDNRQIAKTASIQAKARGLRLVVVSVDRAVTVMGDRQILAAALSNLIQTRSSSRARGAAS